MKLLAKSRAWMRLAFMIGSLAIPASTLAVDGNGAFELDGNPQESADPGDDWSTLFTGGGSPNAFVFIEDQDPEGDDIFTGGGSKVPLDFDGYKWKLDPPPPDKNNIVNAFAANYVVSGEQIIYFGADLYAENGDAELGFWFLQDEVTLVSGGSFSGEHIDGDVYAAVKFSNGGAVAIGAVYEWDSSCNKDDKTPAVPGSCASKNIRIIFPEQNALCDGASPSVGCAITNESPVAAAWPYTPKSGADGTYPTTTFFEAGLNIFDLFDENKCFSTFMLSTGASTSFQSTAKDFARGDFNVCSIAATKTCVNDDMADDVPTAISYNVRGCGYNDGGGTVNIQGLANSIGGGDDYIPDDLAWFEPPGSFDPETDCSDASALAAAVAAGTPVADPASHDLAGGDTLVYQFSEVTAINGPTDEVTVMADGADGTLIEPAEAMATCPNRVFNADLSADKVCSADLEDSGDRVVVKINISGQVCNDGEVTLTNLMLSDSTADGTPVLNPASQTILPGNCVNYTGYYYPASIPTGNSCPFMDMVTAQVQAPVNSSGGNCTDNGDGTQTCSVNSNSATCLLRVTDDDMNCATGLPNPDPND